MAQQSSPELSEWESFPEDSGSLNIPRASMPQIKSEHRGAMVQYLKGRGITHSQEDVAPNTLRPSQAEYSPEKVERARGFEGPQRSILVSSDGYVADGHHQWLSSLHDAPDQPIPAIRLHAPIHQLLIEAARFPSSGVDEASTDAAASSQPLAAGQDDLNLSGVEPLPQTTRALRRRTPPAVADPVRVADAATPAARQSHPHGAYDSQTDGEWSIGDSFKVKDYFRQTYGRDLPVTALGESATHRSMGLDHSDSMDVGINPTSAEGQALIKYLRDNHHPFLAYDRAVPGAATAPHIHVGFPSHGGEGLNLSGVEPINLQGVEPLGDEQAAASPTDDEVVSTTTSAPRYQQSALPSDPHSLPRLSLPAQPNLETYAGRQQRDLINSESNNADARLIFDVHLPAGARDWSQVDDKGAVRAGVLQYAQTNDIPEGYTRKWLDHHAEQLHFNQDGKPVQPIDLIYPDSPHYDAEKRTLRVATSLPIFKKLRDDYVASLPAADKFGEWLYGKSESGGEKMLDVAVPVVHGAAKVADVVSRPLAAVDANFWSKVNRPGLVNKLEALSNPLDTHALAAGYDALKGETPEDAHNPIAAAVRNNATLKATGFDSLAGGITEALTSPSNLVLAGAGKAGMEALKGTRAGAQLAEAMGGGERLTEFFNRGGRVLDIEQAASDGTKAADGLLVTLKDEAGNLSHVNTATGEVSEVKTLPRIMGMTVPEALEKHPKLEEYVAHSLQNAQERAASFETEAARADLPQDYKQTHAEEAARAHDEAAYLRDVQAAIEEHRNPAPSLATPPEPPATEPLTGTTQTATTAAQPTGPATPETLSAQLDALKGGQRPFVEVMPEMLADPNEKTTVPRGFRSFKTLDGGRIIYDPRQMSREQVVAAMDAGTLGAHGVPLADGGTPLPAVGESSAPRPSGFARARRAFVNAYHLPKSVQASADLSATLRQGLIPLAAHPSFIKDVMANQVKAFASEDAASALKDAIINHPDFPLMKDSGLYLSSVRGSAPEEMFSSGWSEKIPLVKQSDRAYSAALDTVRVKSFEIYAAELKAAGATDEKTFSDIAHWINRATGRGEGKLVDALAPILNFPMFSPRLTASRFQVLNPVFYLKMTPAARRIAVREMCARRPPCRRRWGWLLWPARTLRLIRVTRTSEK